jgi:hypothetical protein
VPAKTAVSAAAIAWQMADIHGQEMLHRCRLLPMISTSDSASHSTPTTSQMMPPWMKLL